eukprot:TRINITY_DN4489_c0_g1_i1.p1 TRINITY_DN4489_c0_g1~~TRINITY_DN4489_c0_g1_i1.p1  ORF type:complete len:197 (-),score=19.40 TRINITY_DN4489_c0_g1_i1:216-806(-)
MNVYVGTEYSSDPEGDNEDPKDRDPAEVQAVRKMMDAEMHCETRPCDGGTVGLPGLGISEGDLNSITRFRLLRSSALRNFIECDGCTTVEELRERVRASRQNPPKAPSWYQPSARTMGARRIGLQRCGAMNCPRSETEASGPFKLCGACKVPYYCSAACQKEDWNHRHKLFCKKAKEQRDQMQRVSAMLEAFSRKS